MWPGSLTSRDEGFVGGCRGCMGCMGSGGWGSGMWVTNCKSKTWSRALVSWLSNLARQVFVIISQCWSFGARLEADARLSPADITTGAAKADAHLIALFIYRLAGCIPGCIWLAGYWSRVSSYTTGSQQLLVNTPDRKFQHPTHIYWTCSAIFNSVRRCLRSDKSRFDFLKSKTTMHL